VYVTPNTNLLHTNTIFTQHTTNTMSTCNTNTATTQAKVQQVTEADWLMTPRDSKCAKTPKTGPPPYVPVTSRVCHLSFLRSHWWCQRPWCGVKNASGMLVYFKEYTLPTDDTWRTYHSHVYTTSYSLL
jgi:hypothetical protein